MKLPETKVVSGNDWHLNQVKRTPGAQTRCVRLYVMTSTHVVSC